MPDHDADTVSVGMVLQEHDDVDRQSATSQAREPEPSVQRPLAPVLERPMTEPDSRSGRKKLAKQQGSFRQVQEEPHSQRRVQEEPRSQRRVQEEPHSQRRVAPVQEEPRSQRRVQEEPRSQRRVTPVQEEPHSQRRVAPVAPPNGDYQQQADQQFQQSSQQQPGSQQWLVLSDGTNSNNPFDFLAQFLHVPANKSAVQPAPVPPPVSVEQLDITESDDSQYPEKVSSRTPSQSSGARAPLQKSLSKRSLGPGNNAELITPSHRLKVTVAPTPKSTVSTDQTTPSHGRVKASSVAPTPKSTVGQTPSSTNSGQASFAQWAIPPPPGDVAARGSSNNRSDAVMDEPELPEERDHVLFDDTRDLSNVKSVYDEEPSVPK